MSTRFPRFRPKNAGVIEVEDLNESLQGIVEETAGRLNEHNFDVPTTTLTDLSEDVLRMHQVSVTDSIHGGGYPTANTDTLAYPEAWFPIADMELTFNSYGGLLWILCSFQLDHANVAVYQMFAVRLNGQIISESTIGTLDRNGDPSGTHGIAPVCVEALVPVPPGNVTVDVVGMSEGTAARIATRELIILEFTS